MLTLFWENQFLGEVFFIMSLVAMNTLLLISLAKILKSGPSLKIALEKIPAPDLKNK
jgi:hypothetical protein